MNLASSASLQTRTGRDGGYAMAALLIGMSVMAILLTVALPTWKQTIQREKEEELIFRGNQYARAISAYQRKFANASPTTIDVLVEQHYLRKKFKDPVAVTEDGEFQPLYIQAQGTANGAQGASSGTLASTNPSGGGGIIGVASKNTAQSIRQYNGRTHYNEWQFIPVQQSTRGGPTGPNTGTQGGQGNQQQGGQQGGNTPVTPQGR